MKLKYLALIIIISSVIYCTLGSSALSKEEMIAIIKENTTLTISDNFKILRDTIAHTENAFDSDYWFEFIIKFDENESHKTIQTIKTLRNYWKSEDFYLRLDSSEFKTAKQLFQEIGTKGLWHKYKEGFIFTNQIIETVEDFEPNQIWVGFDTIKKELTYSLCHL